MQPDPPIDPIDPRFVTAGAEAICPAGEYRTDGQPHRMTPEDPACEECRAAAESVLRAARAVDLRILGLDDD